LWLLSRTRWPSGAVDRPFASLFWGEFKAGCCQRCAEPCEFLDSTWRQSTSDSNEGRGADQGEDDERYSEEFSEEMEEKAENQPRDDEGEFEDEND
jgi:hypothetical protein